MEVVELLKAAINELESVELNAKLTRKDHLKVGTRLVIKSSKVSKYALATLMRVSLKKKRMYVEFDDGEKKFLPITSSLVVGFAQDTKTPGWFTGDELIKKKLMKNP